MPESGNGIESSGDATSDALNCDLDVTGNAEIDDILNKFTVIAGDACIYGCFLSILYEHSVQKFIDAKKAGTEVGAAIISFITRNFADPTEGAANAILAQLLQMVELYMNSVENLVKTATAAFEGMNFADIVFSIVKSTLARYAKQIVMAAVQGMVKDMEAELINREALLYKIRVSLDKLDMGLSNAAQYDWWTEFVQATQEADVQLNDARRSFSTAYDSSREGNWNTEVIERGQVRLLVALQRLSSVKDIEDLVSELQSDFMGSPYLPFDAMFKPVKAAPLWEALDNIRDALEDLLDDNNCLAKTTFRLQQLRGFILAAEGTLKWLDSQVGINMALDIVMNDAVIGGVVQSILDIQTDMRRVISEHNRLIAPISLATWKIEIKSQVELLKLFGSLPTPWGAEAYGEEGTALAQLQYLLHQHTPSDGVSSMDEWDFSSTFVTDVVAMVIRSAGNIQNLVTNKPQWNSDMARAKSNINKLARKDATAAQMLHMFVGHESDKYDYILQLLETSGMGGAKRLIERAQMISILEATALMSVSAGGALACLSSMFGDRAGMSIETQAAIDSMYDTQLSDAKAAVRSLNTMPSMQFRALGVLQMQINDSLNDIAFISNLMEGGC